MKFWIFRITRKNWGYYLLALIVTLVLVFGTISYVKWNDYQNQQVSYEGQVLSVRTVLNVGCTYFGCQTIHFLQVHVDTVDGKAVQPYKEVVTSPAQPPTCKDNRVLYTHTRMGDMVANNLTCPT